jgi:hypothetical protein
MTVRASTAATTYSNPGDVIIRQEDDEGGKQMVTVSTSPLNQIFDISKNNLSQSSVLYGYIRGKPGGLFIMQPELMGVSSGSFEAVDEFLEMGKFQPAYLAKERTAEIGLGCKPSGWPGCTCLQGSIKLSKMQLLIRQKLISGFPRGHPRKRC